MSLKCIIFLVNYHALLLLLLLYYVDFYPYHVIILVTVQKDTFLQIEDFQDFTPIKALNKTSKGLYMYICL